MTMHRAWIRVTAAAATTAIATWGGQFAAGQSQYGPYATAPQYIAPATTTPQTTASQYTPPRYSESPYAVTAPAAPYGVQPTPPAQAAATTQPPAYPTTSSPVYYTAAVTPYATVPSHAPASDPRYAPAAQTQQVQQSLPQYQPPRYQAPGARRTYPALAQQPTGTVMPGVQPTESLPTPDPAAGYSSPAPQPSTNSLNGYAASDPGYMGGGYQDYGYGACDCEGDCGGSQWFGGIYGLYMTRTRPGYQRYTVGVDAASASPATPIFPPASATENESDCAYLVPHWRGGIEARIGATFGIGDSCDYGDCNTGCGTNGCEGNPCGCEPCCQPCCQQMFAWEVAYWGIGTEVQDQFVDGPVVGTFRYYGMINYAGLEYDDGGGAQPVNDFYNYQSPITGVGAETVLAQRVRTNFWAQNFELNFLRLPLYTGACNYDCGAAPFSLTGLCGVRYFRMDDDFEFGTEWDVGNPFDGWKNGTNELFQDIQMKNQLVGFQLGANMNYCVASRWNFFWDTNFGFYNNHIEQSQRIYNPLLGNAVFTQEGREANVNSTKDTIAFLGEMRLGGGYLFTPNWRGTIAYRAIGVGGAAFAPDQIKPTYDNFADTARIDSDGSIVIHGIQAGIECNY